jgi:transposase
MGHFAPRHVIPRRLLKSEALGSGVTIRGAVDLRQAKAKPLLEDIHAYLEREQPQVLPKSPGGQAIAYTLSNWKALTRCSEDGDLEIDNNGAERSLRGVAIGRKNWTFLGSDNGGRTAAVLTSLIATSKKLGIDPFAYVCDIFERISTHPQSRLAELLPDQWLAARRAATLSSSCPELSTSGPRLVGSEMGST